MRRFFVGTLILAAGCATSGTAPRLSRYSSWKVGSNHATYTVLSDPGGLGAMPAIVLNGSWDLLIAADSSITGTWTAHAVSGPDSLVTRVGPQVGSGHLEGRLRGDGSLSVNMNPGTFDNNVFVSVGPRGGDTDATWEWSTFAGPTAHGSFRLSSPTVF
ncbi:MAG TPA: hypothetical protein VJN62_00310 [Gemmatimonadales bacterium]|nr:hypothetical protein [Gemmatimonadales bacterium]